MNKDLDERIVPKGQYRDALNIQISTSDSGSSGIGNVGTVQNLKGNRMVSEFISTTDYNDIKSKIIASVADEGKDRAYFFTAAPVPIDGLESITHTTIINSTVTERIWVDSILEVEVLGDNEIVDYIIVDKFAVTGATSDVFSSVTPPNGITAYTNFSVGTGYGEKIRVGMNVYAIDADGNNLLSDGDNDYVQIVAINNDIITLASEQTANLGNAVAFKFIHPERVLEFDYYKGDDFESINLIPNASIDILNDLLMWSDGKHEPKKINIERCRAGTSDVFTHTKLFVKQPGTDSLTEISNLEYTSLAGISADIKKEHITVIKKAPTTPPTVEVKSSDREFDQEFPLQYSGFVDQDGNIPQVGDTRYATFPSIVDYRIDDIYNFVASNTVDPISIRAKIIDINELDLSVVTLEILFVDSDLNSDNNPSNWIVELEKKKPFFEAKFGRFGYRYKYEDNECSTFSPWSELAFLPGEFEYTSKNGFNEGMTNTARQIIVRNWLPSNYTRPLDVKTIDILWKTTDDSNIYIVKSIKRGVDTEWKDMNVNVDLSNTGEFVITSEMIYKVIEENQLLRAWDNVPRFARAQAITSNRLVYGNYVQGYNLDSNIGLLQSLVSEKVYFPNPKKSVKSLRSYQWGMVFGDKYGRETPVIANGYKTEDGQLVPGTSKVLKSLASTANKFKLQQNWPDSDPTSIDWIDYVKYYVKETSNEYYNLVLDRWYDAGDDNIWLAFNSADRNKIDEEGYLILKNGHGTQQAVEEEARYKVIAISNEAPDFIRQTEKKFPLVGMTAKHIYGDDGSGNALSPVTGHPNNIIADDDGGNDANQSGTDRILSDLFDDQNLFEGIEFKGKPELRIVGRYTDTDGTKYEAFSPYREITRIIEGGNNGGEFGYGIRDPFFLTDVDMYEKIRVQLPDVSTIGTANDAISEISFLIEARDLVLENRPEFDGKFFVKISKDDVLENKVLGDTLGEYQVTSTYEIAYLSDEQTNNAEDNNDYASDPQMAFETFSWPNAGSVFTNSNIAGTTTFSSVNGYTSDDNTAAIPNFGNLVENGTNLTDSFWVVWSNSPNRTADIFIDNVPAYQQFNLQSNSGVDALTEYNAGYTPINTVDGITNWHPTGLSNGSFSDGTLGQIMFSVIGPDGFTGQNSYFKAKMQTPGTLFRFADDPNQQIYRVFESNQIVTDDDGNESIASSTQAEISSFNFDNNGSSSYALRSTIIVRFSRVDVNNEDMGTGLDPMVWDPRGTVQHNGLGSLTLDVVERVAVQGLSEDAIATTAACFETEPKEDLGLDIYYEASSAIPIRLRQDNIRLFTTPNQVKERASSFVIYNRALANNNNIDVNLTGNPFIYQTIGDDVVQVKRKIINSEINLQTIITNNVSDGICAAIDDIVGFKRRDGLVTKSKIVDHAKLLPTGIAAQSDRYTIPSNGVLANIGVPIADSNASNVTVGMQVTGENVQAGTFITQITDGAIIRICSLNQQLITNGDSSFTFIDVTGYFQIEKEVWKFPVELGWFNCYSFGNGVESDRIRDDFNTPQIDNGIKVSSTFLEYGQENKESSMIFSGLYNSTSGVNDLNQFNMAEKITKDLNTTYGSIQAMKTRDNDVVVFAEDKILKVLSSGRDALFNADGNAQLTATSRVLGTAMPFAGDYGISKNPESLASDAFRMYFADQQRGAVLRLSRDGLTPISDVGMKNYFRENLKWHINITGSFDGINDEYNLTLHKTIKFGFGSNIYDSKTISFNEASKGWISFKSFTPLTAIGLADRYYSVDEDAVWKHYHDSVERNSFYNTQGKINFESTITLLFNDMPSSVKSFKTINYEGSQAKVSEFTTQSFTDATGNTATYNDGEYYNLSTKTGWHVDSIQTDLEEGFIGEFIDKENKWYNYIRGSDASLAINSNYNQFEKLAVQGIGFPLVNPTDTQTESNVTIQAVDPDGENL